MNNCHFFFSSDLPYILCRLNKIKRQLLTGWECFFMLFLFCLLGMDLLKHGESAYPADAWVEAQYMKEDAVMSVSNHLKSILSG